LRHCFGIFKNLATALCWLVAAQKPYVLICKGKTDICQALIYLHISLTFGLLRSCCAHTVTTPTRPLRHTQEQRRSMHAKALRERGCAYSHQPDTCLFPVPMCSSMTVLGVVRLLYVIRSTCMAKLVSLHWQLVPPACVTFERSMHGCTPSPTIRPKTTS